MDSDTKREYIEFIVRTLVHKKIQYYHSKYRGWICGFGYEKRYAHSVKRFSKLSNEEIEFLYELLSSSSSKTEILAKYRKNEDEAKALLSKAASLLPGINFRRYLIDDD